MTGIWFWSLGALGLLLLGGGALWAAGGLRSALARLRKFARLARRGAPKLSWILFAILAWAIFAYLVARWLGGSDLEWWRIGTWLTPAAELTPTESKSVREIQIDELRNLFGALVILVGSFVGALQIGNSLHRTHLMQTGRDADQERLNAEIFSKAAEQLGSDKIATRLGAIYSLEALALSDQASGETHLTNQIMETLASFVRDRSDVFRASHPAAAAPSPPDITAAFTVLARSYPFELRPSLETGGVDLRKSYLTGVRLYQGTDLRAFNMSGAQLNGASLYGCDLRGDWLSGGDLTGARLTNARIGGAYFANASWGDCRGVTREMIAEAARWEPHEAPRWPSYLQPAAPASQAP